MLNKSVQISLFDIYNGVLSSIEEKKPELILLLDEYIDFDTLIPYQFSHAFYRNSGRKHKYLLESFIRALVLQKLLGFNTDKQLLIVLKCSKGLRDFCGFHKVPDASQITRFKQTYCEYLVSVFERLVDITEPMCREISAKKADYLIFDTTGIEPYVSENNPKFLNTKLKEAKKLSKSNTDSNPYISVYGLLPETSRANECVKQQYINGHYCYAMKAGIVTNGIGIIRHISFFDSEFKKQHLETVTKRSDNPDIDKEIGDSVALKPVLSDFYAAHPSFPYSTFIGDSAFDSYDNYSLLRNEFGFSRIAIPLNPRNSKASDARFNEFGTPVCPFDKTPFVFLGKSGGKNRSMRYKWVCHKSVQKGTTRICNCDTPCTDSLYGKCVYTYPDKNFRLYPGIPRNTEHWDNLYRHRVTIERTINLFKDSFGLDSRKSFNSVTLNADLYLAGIVQLLGVILAKAFHKPELFKSVRRLIAAAS